MADDDPEDVLECARILIDFLEVRARSGTKAIMCHLLYSELLRWQQEKNSRNVWSNIPNPIFLKAVFLLQSAGLFVIKDIRYETVEDYEKNCYVNKSESKSIRDYQNKTPGLPYC